MAAWCRVWEVAAGSPAVIDVMTSRTQRRKKKKKKWRREKREREREKWIESEESDGREEQREERHPLDNRFSSSPLSLLRELRRSDLDGWCSRSATAPSDWNWQQKRRCLIISHHRILVGIRKWLLIIIAGALPVFHRKSKHIKRTHTARTHQEEEEEKNPLEKLPTWNSSVLHTPSSGCLGKLLRWICVLKLLLPHPPTSATSCLPSPFFFAMDGWMGWWWRWRMEKKKTWKRKQETAISYIKGHAPLSHLGAFLTRERSASDF